jgi:pimeloyl-ACP methyl ester carboxylesterase
MVTLADTGHMLMLERYAEVNQVLRDLLVRVRRTHLASA